MTTDDTAIPDGPFPYMFGPEWQAMKQAAKECISTNWRSSLHDPNLSQEENLRRRLEAATTENKFIRAKFDEIADQHVRDALKHRQSVGKAYGRASRKIHELRTLLQARAQFQREAIRNCTCGAWRRTRNELFELTKGDAAVASDADVTRVDIIGDTVHEFWADEWTVRLMDEGRTLKFFADGDGAEAKAIRDKALVADMKAAVEHLREGGDQ